MTKKRICLNCGGPVPPERQSGAKYCKDSCKARYHEKKLMKELLNNREVQKPDSEKEKKDTSQVKQPGVNFPEELRGVIENKTEEESSANPTAPAPEKGVPYADLKQNLENTDTQTREETQAYKEALAKKMEEENKLTRILNAISNCDTHLKNLEEIIKQPLPSPKKKNVSLWCSDAHLFYDEQEDEREWEHAYKLERAEKQKFDTTKEIADLKQKKENVKKMIEPQKLKFKEAEELLKKTPQYKEIKIEKQILLPNILEAVKQNKIQEKKKVEDAPSAKEEKTEEQPAMESNSRIISVKQLKQMRVKTLNFRGKWKDFFGMPSTKFHLVVHGNPGSGKSTFCFQFANYLAENHGKVIYISSEEGFSPTMRKKAEETQADSPNLFFANFKTAAEIKEHIENIYPFIVIDSLNNMGIDAEELRDLREHFSNSTFITICQSTKNGNMRGSQEIVHDADMVVSVVKRIAKTSKNRFFETEMEYYIFPKKEDKIETKKPEKKEMETLRNVV